MNTANAVASESTKRLVSLDLLRILCMLLIVCGHAFIYGGNTTLAGSGISPQGIISNLLSTFCCVAVNIFILSSGFFLATQRFRLSRLAKLALEVLFYSWIILIVNKFFLKTSLSTKDIITMLLPVSYGHYWFISAYFGISLLAPVLNYGLRAMTKKQHFLSVCVMLVCFSLWSDLIPRSNALGVGSGYCLSWFIVLYFIAAYIRNYVNISSINKGKALAVFFISMLIVFALNSAASLVSDRIPALQPYELGSFFSRYNCLLVVFGSVSLFCTFLGIDVKNPFLVKVSAQVPKWLLGVYLIHGGPYTSYAIWGVVFSLFHIENTLVYPLMIVLASAALFVVCICVDYVRSKIFALWENRTWFTAGIDRIGNWMKETMEQRLFKIAE